MKLEQRFINSEVKTSENKIGGLAIPYGETSSDMGFKEIIEQGAFNESIETNTIKALWSHDTSKILGSTKNSTLKIENKNDGLYFECELPDTQVGKDAKTLIERGDVDGVSFGFYITEESWNDEDKNNIVRTVKKGELIEISPVAFPAYPQTAVDLRTLYNEQKKDEPTGRISREKLRLKLMEVENG